MVNEELLDVLGCPICKSRLDWKKEERKLYCKKCDKKYHITNSDVPILVPNQEEYEQKYNKNYNV